MSSVSNGGREPMDAFFMDVVADIAQNQEHNVAPALASKLAQAVLDQRALLVEMSVLLVRLGDFCEREDWDAADVWTVLERYEGFTGESARPAA